MELQAGESSSQGATTQGTPTSGQAAGSVRGEFPAWVQTLQAGAASALEAAGGLRISSGGWSGVLRACMAPSREAAAPLLYVASPLPWLPPREETEAEEEDGSGRGEEQTWGAHMSCSLGAEV